MRAFQQPDFATLPSRFPSFRLSHGSSPPPPLARIRALCPRTLFMQPASLFILHSLPLIEPPALRSMSHMLASPELFASLRHLIFIYYFIGAIWFRALCFSKASDLFDYLCFRYDDKAA